MSTKDIRELLWAPYKKKGMQGTNVDTAMDRTSQDPLTVERHRTTTVWIGETSSQGLINTPGEAENPHGFPRATALAGSFKIEELPTQVRRQSTSFEGLIGHDLKPEEQTERIQGPREHDTIREQLSRPSKPQDIRQRARKPIHPQQIPRFNHLYGSNKVEGSWSNVVDVSTKGTITTVAGATTPVAVTLSSSPHFLLSRWPGAINMFLCIRQFSIAPQTATFTTLGALDISYADLIGGQIIPICDILNSGVGNFNDMAILIPTPVTDPDNPVIGQILVGLNTGATVGTYNWQIGFSAAYLVPQVHGFDIEQSNPFVEVETTNVLVPSYHT